MSTARQEEDDRVWAMGMGDSWLTRERGIRELLRHANADRMSASDREVCRRMLIWVQAELKRELDEKRKRELDEKLR